MSKYSVQIPFVGFLSFEVDANSEDEAVEIGWLKAGDMAFTKQSINIGSPEWECVEEISRGNVLNAPLNELSVDLIS